MVQKIFISPAQLVRDSFVFARHIYDSGFLPSAMIVLWRGGTPVGVVVHEFFLFKGVETYHAAVKATSYRGIEKRIVPEIEGLDSVLSRITKKDRVLILDDIFDSGCTVKAVRDRVMERTRSVKIGTLYLRRGRRVTDVRPDYFLKETDQWVVFPHELMDLSPEEIQAKDGDLYDLVTS